MEIPDILLHVQTNGNVLYVANLMRMCKKRLKGYGAIGYTVQRKNGGSTNQQPDEFDYIQAEDL